MALQPLPFALRAHSLAAAGQSFYASHMPLPLSPAHAWAAAGLCFFSMHMPMPSQPLTFMPTPWQLMACWECLFSMPSTDQRHRHLYFSIMPMPLLSQRGHAGAAAGQRRPPSYFFPPSARLGSCSSAPSTSQLVQPCACLCRPSCPCLCSTSWQLLISAVQLS